MAGLQFLQAIFTVKRNTRYLRLFIDDIFVKQFHLVVFDVFNLFDVSLRVLLGSIAIIRGFLGIRLGIVYILLEFGLQDLVCWIHVFLLLVFVFNIEIRDSGCHSICTATSYSILGYLLIFNSSHGLKRFRSSIALHQILNTKVKSLVALSFRLQIIVCLGLVRAYNVCATNPMINSNLLVLCPSNLVVILNIIPLLEMLSAGSFDMHVEFIEVLRVYAVFGGEWLVKCEIRVEAFIGYLLILFRWKGLWLLVGLVVGGLSRDVHQFLQMPALHRSLVLGIQEIAIYFLR